MGLLPARPDRRAARRQYDIVHFSGHGTFTDGRGYISLNHPNGKLDWMDGAALSQIAVNYQATRLVILNVCARAR